MTLAPIHNLQLRFGLADGGSAAADLTVTASDGSTIALADTIIAVFHLTTKASIASMADITSEASIVTAGSIQLSTTATDNDQLLVIWHHAAI